MPSSEPGFGSLEEILRKIDSPQTEQTSKSEAGRVVLDQNLFEDKETEPLGLTPLETAGRLVKKAWEASGNRRTELAEEALRACKDCVDAYVILAEETARSLDAARMLYEEGVRAGERVMGALVFEKSPDDLSSLPQTGAYIRARTGLARCLWSLGDKEGAISHCAEILRLDPADGQGTRYYLANWLLHEELYDDLASLLEAYEGDSAAPWLYSRALWAFIQEGSTEKANGYLEQAFRRNPFVPAYLLGLKKMPGILPEHLESGDEREAVSYIAEALNTWLKTEGALEWLIICLPRVL